MRQERQEKGQEERQEERQEKRWEEEGACLSPLEDALIPNYLVGTRPFAFQKPTRINTGSWTTDSSYILPFRDVFHINFLFICGVYLV